MVEPLPQHLHLNDRVETTKFEVGENLVTGLFWHVAVNLAGSIAALLIHAPNLARVVDGASHRDDLVLNAGLRSESIAALDTRLGDVLAGVFWLSCG